MSPVAPYLVGGFPRGAHPRLYARVVIGNTAGLLNDPAYLQSIDREVFQTTIGVPARKIGTSSPKREELLISLMWLIGAWGKQ